MRNGLFDNRPVSAIPEGENIWVAIGLHVLLTAIIFSVCYSFGIFIRLPENNNLIVWDTFWYEKIMQEGYTYSDSRTSSAAFFPLFPYVWRWSGLTAQGISLVNLAVFLVSFGFLARQFRFTARQALLLLSTPVLLYMGVAYSEAWFFLFGSLLLVGLHKNRFGLFLAGLFFCGLTRSAATMFAPALLFTMLLSLSPEKQNWPRVILRTALAGLSMAAAMGSVMYIQYVQTGEPLGFAKAQKQWSHVFTLPKKWLYTEGGINVLWIDALAFLLCVSAAGGCLYLLIRWIKSMKQTGPVVTESAAVVFALGYCVCVGLFILFFQGGNLANIARYVFATPFFAVLLWKLYQLGNLGMQRYVHIGLAAFMLWIFFGAFGSLQGFTLFQSLWYFGLVTVYLLAYLVMPYWSYGREAFAAVYVFNIFMQFYLLNSFLQYYWIE